MDCAYLGLLHLAPRLPSLVVSGVNAGYNLGTDVFYSGTVAAAVEGALRKIPAIAVGRANGGNQHTLSEWAEPESAKTATKQVVLLAVSLAELAR